MERLIRIGQESSQDQGGMTWWQRYRYHLDESGFSSTAISVLESDCQYLLNSGLRGVGHPGDSWPEGRFRSGITMGAVQSGKTASIMGLAAMALDDSVDVIVVLAGTRIALWKQTYFRLARQLQLAEGALFFPALATMDAGQDQAVPMRDLFPLSSARARRALRSREPIVLVVMKHGQHLSAAARMLHDRVFPQIREAGRPVEMLVLDDEADDGSILDAVVEGGLDPRIDHLKQIPRHIVDLWSQRPDAPATCADNLFCTYVAYTATPQANFAQEDVNPLAPRDFIASLRTPFSLGELAPREITFREPRGYLHYYTGGDTFYRRDGDLHPLVFSEADLEPDEPAHPIDCRCQWIGESLRAFLVAGAIRLWRDPKGRRLGSDSSTVWETRDQVLESCPDPHSMLYHPAARVEEHFFGAAEILSWLNDDSFDVARAAIDLGVRKPNPDAVARRLRSEGALWREWLNRFGRTSRWISEIFDLESAPAVPHCDEWDAIEELILDEIVPNLHLSVVNSRPEADDRPNFAPKWTGEGWEAPSDVYTIFISGNVMARGLTLEGLNTTVFLRDTADPAADTQMQMQRWMGYRGQHIDLCRVFMEARQARLFAEYDEADAGLRQQVLAKMNEGGDGPAPRPTVIQGLRFRATAKIAGLRRLPLSPGANPTVRIVNASAEVDPNLTLVGELFDERAQHVTVNGTFRGLILAEPLSLLETAALLERLRYDDYRCDSESFEVTRWRALEAQLNLDTGEFLPLWRAPSASGIAGQQTVNPQEDPYQIAAYLRLWRAALDRRARGLYPTDDGSRPWSSLDLATRRVLQPRFYVGLRFGSMAPISGEEAERLGLGSVPAPIRPMRRDIEHGRLKYRAWGTMNPGDGPDSYLGDRLFDYHFHHQEDAPTAGVGSPLWRPVGAPGQVLFQVVRADEQSPPSLAVGISIPLGGPDQFAAVTTGRLRGDWGA